jgi:phosphoenolpyruvate carboxylase
MKIPRVMSTQHPDSVQLPFFAGSLNMETFMIDVRLLDDYTF